MFHSSKRGAESEKRVLPRHIAIIMDGNGRWAQKRGLPRTAGHSAGAANFRKITRYCSKIGIKYLTIYAFSTENWKRPPEEVSAIMSLFHDYLLEALEKFRSDNIKVRFIGDRTPLDDELKRLMSESEDVMKNATGMVLNIAINYGGRQEITAVAASLAKDAAEGRISPEKITEEDIASRLYTAGQPDPDLIIRPSGELRMSNFLLWQSAYSEFWSSDVLWPDFKPEHLEQAISDYGRRHRRYGGVAEKADPA